MVIFQSNNGNCQCDVAPITGNVKVNFASPISPSWGYNSAVMQFNAWTQFGRSGIHALFIWDTQPTSVMWFGSETINRVRYDSVSGYWYYDNSVLTGYNIYTSCTSSVVAVFNKTDTESTGFTSDVVEYIQTPIVNYQWSSVPAISGKMGILSLTEILNINNGEPVNNVAASGNVDFAAKTKVNNLVAAVMENDDDHTKATVTYEIQANNYEYVKLTYKKNQIPEEYDDGTPIDISDMSGKVVVENLDERSTYYFGIFTDKSTSDPYKYSTGVTPEDEEYEFEYTGSIQTFTAPKTGIYQLETWGAQGGNASDDNLVARGGYGAYAKGEVFLTQGETIYINVGGQNGYGGGGYNQRYIQIDSWLAGDGNTYDLLKINDFSIIPSSVIDSSVMTYSRITSGSSALPSYIDNLGDLIHHSDKTDLTNNITIPFCDNNKLKVSVGKHTDLNYNPSDFFGTGFYDINRGDINYPFLNDGWSSDVTQAYSNVALNCYIGIVLDMYESRGYIIYDSNLSNHPSRTGHNIYVIGGKSNGVDLIWETFKGQI